MKKLILCLSLCYFTLGAFAQVQVAITGGLHAASVTPGFGVYPDSTKYLDTAVSTSKTPTVGIAFGFIADVPIKHGFYFRSGVLIAGKGSNWTQTYDTANLVASTSGLPDDQKNKLLSYNTKLHLTYIDVPFDLLYKLKIKGKIKFMIGGGPQLSLLYNGYKDLSTAYVSQQSDSAVQFHYAQEKNTDLPIGKLPEHYRIFHWGANVLAGFDFGRVYLTANYTTGLNAFYEEAGRKYKHQTIGATIGIYLGKFETKVTDK